MSLFSEPIVNCVESNLADIYKMRGFEKGRTFFQCRDERSLITAVEAAPAAGNRRCSTAEKSGILAFLSGNAFLSFRDRNGRAQGAL